MVDGKCFYINSDLDQPANSYHDYERLCKEKGARIASIETDQEANLLKSELPQGIEWVWLGAVRQEGPNFLWADDGSIVQNVYTDQNLPEGLACLNWKKKVIENSWAWVYYGVPCIGFDQPNTWICEK